MADENVIDAEFKVKENVTDVESKVDENAKDVEFKVKENVKEDNVKSRKETKKKKLSRLYNKTKDFISRHKLSADNYVSKRKFSARVAQILVGTYIGWKSFNFVYNNVKGSDVYHGFIDGCGVHYQEGFGWFNKANGMEIRKDGVVYRFYDNWRESNLDILSDDNSVWNDRLEMVVIKKGDSTFPIIADGKSRSSNIIKECSNIYNEIRKKILHDYRNQLDSTLGYAAQVQSKKEDSCSKSFSILEEMLKE